MFKQPVQKKRKAKLGLLSYHKDLQNDFHGPSSFLLSLGFLCFVKETSFVFVDSELLVLWNEMKTPRGVRLHVPSSIGTLVSTVVVFVVFRIIVAGARKKHN